MMARIRRVKTPWQSMESAPKDGTHILLLTGDFGVVEGWWNAKVPNFYKSQMGWASYDPENAQGDWVSTWAVGKADKHERLFCGCTPQRWMPKPAEPAICQSCGEDVHIGEGDREFPAYHDKCMWPEESK